MKTDMWGTLFLSEKRKNFLLLLSESPRTLEQVKNTLNVNSSPMMAQIRILMDQGLVTYENDDKFYLSKFGEIITKQMKLLMDTWYVYNVNKKYWLTHDTDAIPHHLMERIKELGHFKIVEPDMNHLFEPPKELNESLKTSTRIMTFYSYFCPDCPTNYSKLAKMEIDYTLILTRPVFERLKNEFTQECQTMLNSKTAGLYIYDYDKKVPGSISVTDDLMLLALFNNEGTFDHKKLISFEESALKWGEELFMHYKSMSKDVKELGIEEICY